eukprot:CFRG5039T1
MTLTHMQALRTLSIMRIEDIEDIETSKPHDFMRSVFGSHTRSEQILNSINAPTMASLAGLSALAGYGGGDSESDEGSTPPSSPRVEENDGESTTSDPNLGTERDSVETDTQGVVDAGKGLKRKHSEEEEYLDYPFSCRHVKLPPTLNGEVDPQLLGRITVFLEKKRAGHNFNERLRNNKSFQNPHICEKLVEHLELNETQSNCPKEIFDPGEFDGKKCYYTDLLTKQKLHSEKLIREARAQAAATTAMPYAHAVAASAGSARQQLDNAGAKAQAVAMAKMLGTKISQNDF